MLNTQSEEHYGILFIFTLFYEYRNLEYVRVPCLIQGQGGGIRYSYCCGCVTGIREYLFNTQAAGQATGVYVGHGACLKGSLCS